MEKIVERLNVVEVEKIREVPVEKVVEKVVKVPMHTVKEVPVEKVLLPVLVAHATVTRAGASPRSLSVPRSVQHLRQGLSWGTRGCVQGGPSRGTWWAVDRSHTFDPKPKHTHMI